MAFRKPITTAGGLFWWDVIKQNQYFIMQEHKTGIPVWPYKYRIIMRENRMEIANSNNFREIDMDWAYLEDHAVPQLDEKIDLSKPLMNIGETILHVVSKIIVKK